YTLYMWTGSSAGVVSNSQTAVVTTPDIYTINAMDANGCEALSQYNISTFAPTSSFTFTNAGLTINFYCPTSGLTYLWNFGDGGTSSVQNPIHTYSSTGSYTVTLTVSNSCGNNVSSQSITVSNIGINEIENSNSITISPNPFT